MSILIVNIWHNTYLRKLLFLGFWLLFIHFTWYIGHVITKLIFTTINESLINYSDSIKIICFCSSTILLELTVKFIHTRINFYDYDIYDISLNGKNIFVFISTISLIWIILFSSILLSIWLFTSICFLP